METIGRVVGGKRWREGSFILRGRVAPSLDLDVSNLTAPLDCEQIRGALRSGRLVARNPVPNADGC